MPETNIIVSFVGDLLDRAKGLMQQNRASLNTKQQDGKTQEKADEAAKGSQKEPRPKRRLRTILRPTAIGGGFPVAIGFYLLGASADGETPFTLTSGNGEVETVSTLEYDPDPIFSDTNTTTNATMSFWFGQTSIPYNPPSNQFVFNTSGTVPGVSWIETRTIKTPEGSMDSSGVEVIGLPLDGKSFVCVIMKRTLIDPSTAQLTRVETTTYDVVPRGIGFPDDYIATVTEVAVNTTTSFPAGKTLNALAYLVSYDSINTVPVPATLETLLTESVPTTAGGNFPDYRGFTASSYGMNEDWSTGMADGFADATGTSNDYFTSGIYAVLQRDPDEWRDVMDNPSAEDPYTPVGAGGFLIEANGLTPFWSLFSCIRDGTCEPGAIGHDRSLNYDSDPGDWIPNREGTTLTSWRPEDGGTVMHVWDGGYLGACRGELLALGFTAEDLAPTFPVP
jgi:hypothetical protein